MKLFRKTEKTNGRTRIYFCGIKIWSYKKHKKIVLKNVYLFDEKGEYKISSLKELPKNFILQGNLDTNTIKIHKKLRCRHVYLTFFEKCSDSVCILDDSGKSNGLDIEVTFQDGVGSELKIGKSAEMNGTKIWLGNGSKLYIGDDCLFSYDITIRTTDGHTIFDKKTKQITNIQKHPCIIGNHCWIGLGTIINKNTQLADNTIVASGSVLTKKITESFCVVAGNPGQVIKRDVEFSWASPFDCCSQKSKK